MEGWVHIGHLACVGGGHEEIKGIVLRSSLLPKSDHSGSGNTEGQSTHKNQGLPA